MTKLILLFLSFFTVIQVFAQDSVVFKHESQLSIIDTGGNTNLQSYHANTENQWTYSQNEFGAGGHYTLGETEFKKDGENIRQETARNWDVHLRYGRQIYENWSAFISSKYESDRFAGFDRRNNFDLGGRYTFWVIEKMVTFIELGARYTEEFPVIGDDFTDSKGRLFFQWENKILENSSGKFWTEYLPNFSRPKDYIISWEASVTTKMSEVFFLQVAYKQIYDNEPAIEGYEYSDTFFSTSLVAKF